MNIYPPVYQCSDGIPRDLATLLSLRSQGFGENVEFYQKNLGTNGHTGMDWPCADGTPVYASVGGRVSYVATDFHVESGGGAGVIIENSQGDCVEWHLSRVDVKVGDQVVVGQQIGLTGDTGLSTGPHIHLEWRPFPLQYNNGFFGAVDYTKDMVWQALPTTIEIMTEKEVQQLQALEGYSDPEGVIYWTGKPLQDYLTARLADKIKTIQQVQ